MYMYMYLCMYSVTATMCINVFQTEYNALKGNYNFFIRTLYRMKVMMTCSLAQTRRQRRKVSLMIQRKKKKVALKKKKKKMMRVRRRVKKKVRRKKKKWKNRLYSRQS